MTLVDAAFFFSAVAGTYWIRYLEIMLELRGMAVGDIELLLSAVDKVGVEALLAAIDELGAAVDELGVEELGVEALLAAIDELGVEI